MLSTLRRLALVLLCTSAAFATTGVAFVHGTGKQTNALNDYWTSAMVDSVRQGLSNSANYTVINCDFEQYMWDADAAGCLAGQLLSFINSRGITDLVVITHSNGGNVMRWILSNPTWDSRYPTIINTIRWVNALAPSSLGTPLADAVTNGTVFESALGWLLGYDNDAVRMQQTSWMAYYNANWLYGTSGRPALPKGFWNVVGTDNWYGTVPTNTVIGARGFLLVWADENGGQNSPTNTDLHANFRLGSGGETLGLFAPEGSSPQPTISFGPQFNLVSQGLYHHGPVRPVPRLQVLGQHVQELLRLVVDEARLGGGLGTRSVPETLADRGVQRSGEGHDQLGPQGQAVVSHTPQLGEAALDGVDAVHLTVGVAATHQSAGVSQAVRG